MGKRTGRRCVYRISARATAPRSASSDRRMWSTGA